MNFSSEATDNPIRPVQHAGSCGERMVAPCGAMLGPFRPAERLRNRDVVCHACGGRYRPHELPMAAQCCGRRVAA